MKVKRRVTGRRPWCKKAFVWATISLIAMIVLERKAESWHPCCFNLNVGYVRTSLEGWPVARAVDDGRFKADNVTVNRLEVDQNFAPLVFNRRLDVVYGVSVSAFLPEAERRGNLVLVGAVLDGPLYSLWTSPDVGSTLDLKGKTIGIPAWDKMEAATLEAVLKKVGLEKVDYRGVPLESPAVANQQWTLGKVDALFMFPGIHDPKKRPSKSILEAYKVMPGFISSGIATSKEFLAAAEHRETLLRFLKSIKGTHNWFRVASDRSLIQFLTKVGVGESVAKARYIPLIREAGPYSANLDVSLDAWMTTTRIARDAGVINVIPNFEGHVDVSLVRSIR